MPANILGKPRVEQTPPEEAVINEELDEPVDEPVEELLIQDIPQTVSPISMIMDSLSMLHKIYFKMTWDLIGATMPDTEYLTATQGTSKNDSEPDPMQILMQTAPTPVRTIMLRRDNVTINKSERVIDETTIGHLDEVMVKSTTEFSVEVLIDDTLFIHETMTDLIDISADISSIVAIYDGTNYRFSISDISYGNLMIRIFTDTSGKFDIFKKMTRGDNVNRH